MNDLHPAALATANWWADKAGVLGTSGGDGFTDVLAIVAGAQGVEMPASQRDSFVAALARRITDNLDRQVGRVAEGATYTPSVVVGVDYGPDTMLADAAREAGVNPGAFPWKTTTWTYVDHVTASLGYGARSVLVWSAENWERPFCGASKWSQSGQEPWNCSLLRYHEEREHRFDVPNPLCGAQIVGYSDERETCNRDAEHEWHRSPDGYVSRMAHDFEPSSVDA